MHVPWWDLWLWWQDADLQSEYSVMQYVGQNGNMFLQYTCNHWCIIEDQIYSWDLWVTLNDCGDFYARKKARVSKTMIIKASLKAMSRFRCLTSHRQFVNILNFNDTDVRIASLYGDWAQFMSYFFFRETHSCSSVWSMLQIHKDKAHHWDILLMMMWSRRVFLFTLWPIKQLVLYLWVVCATKRCSVHTRATNCTYNVGWIDNKRLTITAESSIARDSCSTAVQRLMVIQPHIITHFCSSMKYFHGIEPCSTCTSARSKSVMGNMTTSRSLKTFPLIFSRGKTPSGAIIGRDMKLDHSMWWVGSGTPSGWRKFHRSWVTTTHPWPVRKQTNLQSPRFILIKQNYTLWM